MKLQSDPKKSSSPIYKLNVPYFKNGIAKEWMKFLDNFEKIIIRQDISTGPMQVLMARQSFSSSTPTCWMPERGKIKGIKLKKML